MEILAPQRANRDNPIRATVINFDKDPEFRDATDATCEFLACSLG